MSNLRNMLTLKEEEIPPTRRRRSNSRRQNGGRRTSRNQDGGGAVKSNSSGIRRLLLAFVSDKKGVLERNMVYSHQKNVFNPGQSVLHTIEPEAVYGNYRKESF